MPEGDKSVPNPPPHVRGTAKRDAKSFLNPLVKTARVLEHHQERQKRHFGPTQLGGTI